jgi:hypothetical protein
MPLPSNFQTITLTGNYVDLEGTTLNGSVLFESTSSGDLRDPSADTLIIPIAINASISGGSFSTTIPTTNDPDIIPSFTYRVTETFPSLSLTRTYEIIIPYDIASPFNIADLAPVGENQTLYMAGIPSSFVPGLTVTSTTSTVEFGAIRWLFVP